MQTFLKGTLLSKGALALALSLIMLLGVACGDDDGLVGDDDSAFADYDLDSNAELDVSEFGPTLLDYGTFGLYDANDDGFFDQTEFGEGLFGAFDEDGDGVLDEDEYDAGIDYYYGDEYAATFGDYDADGDSQIVGGEFMENFGTYGAGLYGEFDANDDDAIAEAEFEEGVFGIADEDDSDGIDEDEYDRYASFYAP